MPRHPTGKPLTGSIHLLKNHKQHSKMETYKEKRPNGYRGKTHSLSTEQPSMSFLRNIRGREENQKKSNKYPQEISGEYFIHKATSECYEK